MSNQPQAPAQYPEPTLNELDRAGLRDVANGGSENAKAVEAELARRTPPAA